MKKYWLPSLKLTLAMLILCSVVYPLIVAAIGKFTPGGGNGERVEVNGRIVGYALIGQKFTDDRYFWSRPSAIDYNAASSAGTNKGPTNSDYLKTVQERIDTFLVHNPGINKKDIPAELVTASASGLDPDISPAAAFIQAKRIAALRGLPESEVKNLINSHIEQPLAGLFGPSKINLLQLNIDLDKMKK